MEYEYYWFSVGTWLDMDGLSALITAIVSMKDVQRMDGAMSETSLPFMPPLYEARSAGNKLQWQYSSHFTKICGFKPGGGWADRRP